MQISARKPRVSKPEALCDFSQVWFSTAIGVELLVNWTSPERLPMVVMRSVGLKELKNKLSEYLRLAAAGETVPVTDRDRVCRNWPSAATDPALSDALWWTPAGKARITPDR